MPKKRTKKEQAQKLAEEIGAAPSDPKPRKNLPKRKAKPGQVSGGLSTREAERSLWAPRVESKAPRKKK
jgi:hypothetical protein